MKKYLIIISLLLILTGCESTIKYDFKGDSITSEVTINFTLDEYRSYANNYFGNDFGEETKEVLEESINSYRNNMNAFINNDSIKYNENYFTINNDNYSAKYTYTYNYVNFNRNNMLNYCFEIFNTYEDDNAYYVNLSGESYCTNSKLVITANNMLNNNSNNISNNTYIWTIKEQNNDIYFAISKKELNTNSFNMYYLIYVLVALILGIILYFLNKKYKRK